LTTTVEAVVGDSSEISPTVQIGTASSVTDATGHATATPKPTGTSTPQPQKTPTVSVVETESIDDDTTSTPAVLPTDVSSSDPMPSDDEGGQRWGWVVGIGGVFLLAGLSLLLFSRR
jgi:hypothetical protein